MDLDKKSTARLNTIVYSTEWAKAIALKYLCGYSNFGGNNHVEIAGELDELLSLLQDKKIDFIVIDIPPRNYVGFLCYIRCHYPTLPIIITQPKIFFSDEAVASWFGNIWMREYDSLMAGYPDANIDICVLDQRFASTNSCAACTEGCRGNKNDAQVLSRVEQWMYERLAARVGSRLCARVATEWLSLGISAQEVGKRVHRSDKLVYGYRQRVMNTLRISRHPRELVSSLSLKEGPIFRNCQTICRMRIAA